MSRRPDLIVPIRDRRQRKRIITLRNFGIVTLAVLVIFALLSLDLGWHRGKAGDYGRLFGTQVATDVNPSATRPQIVTEGRVTDQTAADPLLVAPAAREQLLGTPSQQAAAAPAPANYAAVGVPVPQVQTGGGRSVSIVGDASGVAIVRGADDTPRARLSGGVFRQP